MLRRIRARLTYANVISSIALFMAMSGVAWAATTLPKNSVGASQIKKDGVGASEIKKDAVSTSEIKKGAVAADELKDGVLTAAEFAPGTQLKGDKGDPGTPGTPGAPGTIAGTTVQTEVGSIAENTSGSVNAFCPAGQKATGGGGRADDFPSVDDLLISSRPAVSEANVEPPADGQSFQGWRVTAFNLPGGDATIQPEVWVVCGT